MKEFRLIIAGGRNFNDYDLLSKTCDFMLSNKIKKGYKIIIVSGTARGADSLGEKYAKQNNYEIASFPADWSLGKSAGYKRNLEMCMYALESEGGCICFWDSVSKGTKHMIDICVKNNLPHRVIKY